MTIATPHFCAEDFVPAELATLADPQTAIPAIAKDARLIGLIEEAIKRIPTCHDLLPGRRADHAVGAGIGASWCSPPRPIGR